MEDQPFWEQQPNVALDQLKKDNDTLAAPKRELQLYRPFLAVSFEIFVSQLEARNSTSQKRISTTCLYQALIIYATNSHLQVITNNRSCAAFNYDISAEPSLIAKHMPITITFWNTHTHSLSLTFHTRHLVHDFEQINIKIIVDFQRMFIRSQAPVQAS